MLVAFFSIIILEFTPAMLNLVQVEVEYANGSKFCLSAEFLRVYSPAADGKIRSIGGEKVHIINLVLA